MFKEFGVTNLEVTKDDIYKNPSNPILRMYDDDELIGTFSILTGEVLENLDLADYDIRFAQKQIELNRDNYLETWKDYVGPKYSFLILFKNQIQTTSASACRTQVLPAPSFLVCSLIFIEYKSMVLKFVLTNITIKVKKRIFTFISTEKRSAQCF